VQELFPVRKTRLNLSWRGWDVGSSCDRAAGLANPILNLAKTSGRTLVPLNAHHELFVQLAGEPDAKSAPISRSVHFSSGGRGAGTKAEYLPSDTFLPGMLVAWGTSAFLGSKIAFRAIFTIYDNRK
jgi:hypothetical protein